MKTQHIKVTAKHANKFPGIFVALINALLTFSVLPNAWSANQFWGAQPGGSPAAAGPGNWTTDPKILVWSNTATSAAGVAWVDGNVAHFLGKGGGFVMLTSNITAGGISFDLGASPFTIDTSFGAVLTIQGAGIVNNSTQTQTIDNGLSEGGAVGSTRFLNASKAGDATIINFFGSTTFFGTSSADSATITNSNGGKTDFSNTSTGGDAKITNSGGTFSGASGGLTEFFGTSTAGNATITNNGATATGAGAGFTIFNDTSTAGNATIANNGGVTQFLSTSTAGNATITNNGGVTQFFGTSTAGNATITNNGTSGIQAFAGSTVFSGTSTAGSATIIIFSAARR